jgi:hypothetical protein
VPAAVALRVTLEGERLAEAFFFDTSRFAGFFAFLAAEAFFRVDRVRLAADFFLAFFLAGIVASV